MFLAHINLRKIIAKQSFLSWNKLKQNMPSLPSSKILELYTSMTDIVPLMKMLLIDNKQVKLNLRSNLMKIHDNSTLPSHWFRKNQILPLLHNGTKFFSIDAKQEILTSYYSSMLGTSHTHLGTSLSQRITLKLPHNYIDEPSSH